MDVKISLINIDKSNKEIQWKFIKDNSPFSFDFDNIEVDWESNSACSTNCPFYYTWSDEGSGETSSHCGLFSDFSEEAFKSCMECRKNHLEKKDQRGVPIQYLYRKGIYDTLTETFHEYPNTGHVHMLAELMGCSSSYDLARKMHKDKSFEKQVNNQVKNFIFTGFYTGNASLVKHDIVTSREMLKDENFGQSLMEMAENSEY